MLCPTFNGLPAGYLVAILTLTLSNQPCRAAEPPGTQGITISAGPVLQGPTEQSVTITWITDRNATGSVEYGPADGETKTAFSSRHGLIEANQRLHAVVIEGLQPGALYRYRVASREIVRFGAYKVDFGGAVTNEFRQFRALDRRKDAFSFVVLNDIHDQVATIPELLHMAEGQPYDFVVLNGDIVSYSDTEKPVISILKTAGTTFASRIPMFWVRGNHETRGNFARQLPTYLGLPNGRFYYSFDHGPIHFIVLDTGEDKIDSQPEYSGLVDFFRYRREEGEWLKAHVREASFQSAKYRVVICHMPFPSAAAANPRQAQEKVFLGMADACEQFGSTLEAAGIDMMFAGHLHNAAVIVPQSPSHSYPIILGGGHQGAGRTLIRVNVTSKFLEALILRPDGSQFKSCRVEPRVSR